MIKDNSELELDKQHYMLYEAFENWNGQNEQMDDVLILGMRI